jgi:hypothetical protein
MQILQPFSALAKKKKLNLTQPRAPPGSPRRLCQKATLPFANRIFPPLVQQQKTNTKSHGQEPVLDGDWGCRQHSLQGRDVQPEESHDQRKQDGRKEVIVLGELVEDGRVLKYGQAPSANTEEVEPLPAQWVSGSHEMTRTRDYDGTYMTTSVTK